MGLGGIHSRDLKNTEKDLSISYNDKGPKRSIYLSISYNCKGPTTNRSLSYLRILSKHDQPEGKGKEIIADLLRVHVAV